MLQCQMPEPGKSNPQSHPVSNITSIFPSTFGFFKLSLSSSLLTKMRICAFIISPIRATCLASLIWVISSVPCSRTHNLTFDPCPRHEVSYPNITTVDKIRFCVWQHTARVVWKKKWISKSQPGICFPPVNISFPDRKFSFNSTFVLEGGSELWSCYFFFVFL